jgi:ABC-type transport system substrate-binding protein
MAATNELSATDDRTVKFQLKRPFPHLPMALAGPGGTVPAIMPERLAATSPYQPGHHGGGASGSRNESSNPYPSSSESDAKTWITRFVSAALPAAESVSRA